MRFVLFVEGHTEREALPAFLKRWLDPKLSRPIRISAVRLNGAAEYLREIRKKAHLNLPDQGTGADDVGIGLLDLYGLPAYPAGLNSIKQRHAWAKQDIERRVDHPRFRQHFAVHELEAWLLADPGIFQPEIGRRLPKTNPETVDFDTPPAKLLDRLYWARGKSHYRKPIDGKLLFAKLDPNVAYERCPHLALLLDDMLSLAKAAGQ